VDVGEERGERVAVALVGGDDDARAAGLLAQLLALRPVADEAAARAWVERQRGRGWETRVRVEPAQRLAYTRITKAQVEYPQILSAYDADAQWLGTNGLTAGPPREVYFADFAAAAPTDEVCDIAFPFGGIACRVEVLRFAQDVQGRERPHATWTS